MDVDGDLKRTSVVLTKVCSLYSVKPQWVDSKPPANRAVNVLGLNLVKLSPFKTPAGEGAMSVKIDDICSKALVIVVVF